jgi:hypothetical protein
MNIDTNQHDSHVWARLYNEIRGQKTREATFDEIVGYYGRRINNRSKVSYRHFMMETYAPRSKNGVQHRNHTSAALFVKDGAVFTKRRGEAVELTATHVTLATGQTFIGDLRIKSEYLKTTF